MKKSPDKRPHKKEEFQKMAVTKFGTGTKAFRRAWDKAATDSGSKWSQRGAPRKNNHNPLIITPK
jgi:hypothetical protein